MKQSQYNHYIPLENGEYVLYNTLSGAMLIIDEDTKKTIENIEKGEAEFPQEIMDTFKQNDVLVETHEDELLKFRDRYNALRYDPQTFALWLAPTARCNLACKYCWQRADDSLVEKDDQTVKMSESTLKGVLLFVKKTAETLNTTHLPFFFYGGEPLVARDLVFRVLRNLAQVSKECSIDCTMNFYTNCTLVDQQFIDNLQGHNIGMVRTTLDGPQKIHDQYRHYMNGKGTYEKIVASMGSLLDAGINVTVQININRHYNHIPELLDDLSGRGLKQVIVSPRPVYDPLVELQEAQKAYGLLPENFPVPQSTFAIPFKDIPQTKVRIYRWAFKRGFELVPPDMGALSCPGAAYYTYIVDPQGDVYKCSASMLIKNMRVGHIWENGYFERFPFFYEWSNNDPTYVEKCCSCSLLPGCQGGCIHGRKLIPIPCLCEVSSFQGEEYIRMYLKQKYPEKLKSLKV